MRRSPSAPLLGLLALIAALALGCDDDGGGGAPTPDAAPLDAAPLDAAPDADPMPDAAPDADPMPDAGPGCAPYTGPMPPGLVITPSGPIEGIVRDGVTTFRGIPFAAPPIGDLRWRPPAPAACFDAPFEATAPAPRCPQYDADGLLIGDEDCLALDVYTPDPAGAAPVMVWVHGGGHAQGSGSLPFYDGTRLAARGLVVVSVNYRLGPFGFMAHPALTAEGGAMASGTYGMHDQIAALRWVRDHIAAFGGDPARVLVAGQSAGSVSVCRLVVSPLARGLFSAAALHSGGCVATPLADAEATGEGLVEAMGCADAADVPACLRGLDTAAVMAAFDGQLGGASTLGRETFDGVVDGHALPMPPREMIAAGDFAQVPLIIGSTADESGQSAPARIDDEAAFRAAARLFLGPLALPAVLDGAVEVYNPDVFGTWRDAYIAMGSDVKFTCTARTDAAAFAAAGATVHRYWFDKIPDRSGAQLRASGAFHGIDVLYLFGTMADVVPPGPGDEAVIDAMASRWLALAADGMPGDDWPTWDADRDPYLFLGDAIEIREGVRTAQCDFWQSLAGGR